MTAGLLHPCFCLSHVCHRHAPVNHIQVLLKHTQAHAQKHTNQRGRVNMCFVDNCPPEQTHSIADVLTSGLQCFTFAEIKNLGQLNLIVVYYVCVCQCVCSFMLQRTKSDCARCLQRLLVVSWLCYFYLILPFCCQMLFTNLGICCQQHTHTRTPSAEQKHISVLEKQLFSFFRLRKEVHSNTQQSECPLTGCDPACGFTYGLS